MQYLGILAVSSYMTKEIKTEMMKKSIMAIAMLLLSAVGVMAQETEDPVGKFSVIPHVGIGISNWSNNSLGFADGEMVKSKYQAGFTGGVDVEYRVTKEVGVSLGVNYARQGFKFPSHQITTKGNDMTTLDGFNNIHANLDYIQVPLMVRAYVTRNLSLMLGAQVGFLCGDGKLNMDETIATINKNDEVTTKETQTLKSTWPTKKTNICIPIGVAYEYMGVILDARYNLGLTNVSDNSKFKDADGQSTVQENCKSRGFVFSVGYRFTL